MDPLQRLKEAAQAFRYAAQEEKGWFDKSLPECREAERLLKSGDAAQAEKMFRKASEEAKGGWGKSRHRPRMLLALATAEWRQGKLAEARKTGEEALTLMGGEKGRAVWEYGEVCEVLGRAAWEAGDRETALERMKESVAGGKLQREMEGARLVERQRAIGGMLQAAGRTAEAEAAWDEALELAEGRCGSESAAVADCLMDLCGSAAKRGCLAEAKEMGESAVRVRRAACGNDSMDVAKDLETLAGYCQAERDFEAAVRYLEQALQVRDRQIGGNTPELAMLLMALADVYTLLGRIAPALELMRQAVGKLGPGKDKNLSVALEKLGSMYQQTGRYEDAAECYTRARQYWGEHSEEHSEELAANSRALEQLAGLMPMTAAGEAAGAASVEEDSGISVLLPEPSAAVQAATAATETPAAVMKGEDAVAAGMETAEVRREEATVWPGANPAAEPAAPAPAGPVVSVAPTPGGGVWTAPAGWVRAGQPGEGVASVMAGPPAMANPATAGPVVMVPVQMVQGPGGAVWAAPAEWVRAPQGGTQAGGSGSMSVPAAEQLEVKAPAESGWNGWEDVEFELLLKEGEGREP